MAALAIQPGSATVQLSSCQGNSQPITSLVDDAARELVQVEQIAKYRPPVQLVQITQRDPEVQLPSRALTVEDNKLLLKETSHYDTRSFYLQISLPHPHFPMVIMSANRDYILKYDTTTRSIIAEPVPDMASVDLQNHLYHFRREGHHNNCIFLASAATTGETEGQDYTLGAAQDGGVVMEKRKWPARFTVKTAAIVTLPN